MQFQVEDCQRLEWVNTFPFLFFIHHCMRMNGKWERVFEIERNR